MVSLTFRPRMPPWAFTSLAHSWYPFLNAWPSAEKSPFRDSDAPMVIGAVEPPGEAGVLELVEFVQAARTLRASTAPAPMANALLVNRGEAARTPSSSFRLQAWSDSRPPGRRRSHTRWLYRPKPCPDCRMRRNSLIRSEPERLGHASGQLILCHGGVHLDDAQAEAGGFRPDALGEHPVPLQQVGQGPLRVAGLRGDVPQRAPAGEGGAAEARCRAQPDRVLRDGEQRPHQARQQPEPLGDHVGSGRKAEQILDDQPEALAAEPVEGLEHG